MKTRSFLNFPTRHSLKYYTTVRLHFYIIPVRTKIIIPDLRIQFFTLPHPAAQTQPLFQFSTYQIPQFAILIKCNGSLYPEMSEFGKTEILSQCENFKLELIGDCLKNMVVGYQAVTYYFSDLHFFEIPNIPIRNFNPQEMDSFSFSYHPES